MLCHVVSQIDHHFIDEAPAPAIRRIERFHHGMTGGVEVFGCMTIRGGIAAADVTANSA
jgi:hypothetical protein